LVSDIPAGDGKIANLFLSVWRQCRQVPNIAQAHLAQIKAAQHRHLLKKSCQIIPTTTMKRFWTSQAQIKDKFEDALQVKSHLRIPFLGIARPQSQILEIYKSLTNIWVKELRDRTL
jgi:hypothetical protein